ncbi:hypothetical protein E4T48_06699 [Aureobasidium sp. EXF-10727]|nr:hypothetical protein E4T48_06699 [Aureobasidium sp. EXF-10727]
MAFSTISASQSSQYSYLAVHSIMAPYTFPTFLLEKRHGGDVGPPEAAGKKMDISTVVALVIGILALLATVFQTLQQYIGTADGYRRCGPGVMGPWGRKTRLRFRWREFRFEVLYCVPFVEYGLAVKGQDGLRTIRPFCDQPELTTFNPNPPEKQRDWNAELAGWVHLMHNLGLHDQSVRQRILHDTGRIACIDWIRCARVEQACRSWDFVPDDVLRPLAITTLSSLTATTRRLGLSWKQFEPNMGTLQAEGNHQVITSTVIRGMGVIIHYLRDPDLDSDPLGQKLLYSTSPLIQADELLFGRIGHTDLFNLHRELPHLFLHVGTLADVTSTLPALFSDTSTADSIIATLRARSEAGDKDCMEPVNDMVAFFTPFLGVSSDTRPVIPWPNTSARGMTHTVFRPFRDELTALLVRRGSTVSPESHRLLSLYTSLEARFKHAAAQRDRSFSWETPKLTFKGDLATSEAFDARAIWDVMSECESILHANPIIRAGRYHALIVQHLTFSTRIEALATDGDKMKRMFAALPEMARALRSEWDVPGQILRALSGASGEELGEKTEWVTRPSEMQVEDAWLAMMLRAMCWQRLHVVQPGMPLPTEYARSMLPVFIT